MKEQKFLIVDSARDVNEYLDFGWEIVSVTPQYVALAGTSYNYLHGKFAVVIQKQKVN